MIKENLFVLKQTSSLGDLLIKPVEKELARQMVIDTTIPINGTLAALGCLISVSSALMSQTDASVLQFTGT